MTTIAELAALMRLMREHGATAVTLGGTTVTLGALPIKETAAFVAVPDGASLTDKPHGYESAMMPAEPLCRCGHEMVLHDENGCQVSGGCSIETCSKAP